MSGGSRGCWVFIGLVANLCVWAAGVGAGKTKPQQCTWTCDPSSEKNCFMREFRVEPTRRPCRGEAAGTVQLDLKVQLWTCSRKPGPLYISVIANGSYFMLDSTRPITEQSDGKGRGRAYLAMAAMEGGTEDWSNGVPRCIITEPILPSAINSSTDLTGWTWIMAPLLGEKVGNCSRECAVAAERWTFKEELKKEADGYKPCSPRYCPMSRHPEVAPSAGCWAVPGEEQAMPEFLSEETEEALIAELPPEVQRKTGAVGAQNPEGEGARVQRFLVAAGVLGAVLLVGAGVWFVRSSSGNEQQQPLVNQDSHFMAAQG